MLSFESFCILRAIFRKFSCVAQMKAVGFKWMMNQGLEANMDKAIQKLNEQSIRVIVLGEIRQFPLSQP